MSGLKSNIKETAGHAEEELGEAIHDDKMAIKGRIKRNEGRLEQGKAPKRTRRDETLKPESAQKIPRSSCRGIFV